ncbi:hypothetical protein [Legionella fairfieldensis]|uniref:hypothetical protein n=1 Tax=Legionella fairfieldensis TaxID=45064 RepID=UPI00048B5764|nr:hypothetical protein [Legionella fairfieldensis]
MDNMLTVALVVLTCSIIVFFSQEFVNFFKKLFAIPGMTLFLPLLLITALLVYYEPWFSWILSIIQTIFDKLVVAIANVLSFHRGVKYVASVLVLWSLSVLPVWIIDVWYKRKTYHAFSYSYLISTVIWLVAAAVLIVNLQ